MMYLFVNVKKCLSTTYNIKILLDKGIATIPCSKSKPPRMQKPADFWQSCWYFCLFLVSNGMLSLESCNFGIPWSLLVVQINPWVVPYTRRWLTTSPAQQHRAEFMFIGWTWPVAVKPKVLSQSDTDHILYQPDWLPVYQSEIPTSFTDHVPTTYWLPLPTWLPLLTTYQPHTDCLYQVTVDTDCLYWPHTNHILTAFTNLTYWLPLLTTYQPHTDCLYQPDIPTAFTDHILTAFTNHILTT